MIQRVAIIGSGTMGGGIAQLCAQSGFSVKITDDRPQALADFSKRLKASLDAAVLKGRLAVIQAERAFQAVSPVKSLAELFGADLAIEAASEDLGVKRGIFQELGRICPGAILATNTSSLPVAAIAEAAASPGRVLGMHFFNPPVAMKLVELVRGPKTSPEVFQAAWDFALTGLRRVPVDVKDTPGFIVNRVMRPYYLEAQRLAAEGPGIEAVDEACRQEGGLPMGPFELIDLIGLDVNLSITRTLYEALGRPRRLAPPELQARLVAAGDLGRKLGRGFYSYAGGSRQVNERALAFLPAPTPRPGASLWGRVLDALISEAELAFTEGVASRSDIDMAVKLAMNFPKGPFEWRKQKA